MEEWLSLIDKQDFWIVYLIGFIILLQIVVLVIILWYRVNYSIKNDQRVKFRSVLISLLAKALNNPKKQQKYIQKLEKLVRKKWQRELMLDELVDMCYSFQGVYRQRSQDLYDYFELDVISKNKLKSRQWHRVIEGLVELSIVGGEDMYKTVMPLLEHNNQHVRRQAKIAVVEIGRIKGLIAMETKIGVMSKWTFISVLSILHRHPFKLTARQIERLKNSKNPAMRRFSKYMDQYSVAY